MSERKCWIIARLRILRLKCLPFPSLGLLQPGGCNLKKAGDLIVSISISLLCTSLALGPPSCSTGLPLSLSGLGDGKWEKRDKELFFFQYSGSSGFFRDFLVETSNWSFFGVCKFSPSFSFCFQRYASSHFVLRSLQEASRAWPPPRQLQEGWLSLPLSLHLVLGNPHTPFRIS